MNERNLPQAHHVVEFASERQAKTVRICRCWKSQRFPYCDDAHKQLLEHGELVGPYVARIEPYFPNSLPNTNNSVLEMSKPQGKVFTRSALGAGLLVASAAAMAWRSFQFPTLADMRLSCA